jgi:hypothetical protein
MDCFENLPHSSLTDKIGNDIRSQSKLGFSIEQLERLILRQSALFDQYLAEDLILIGVTILGLGTQYPVPKQAQAVLPLLIRNESAGDHRSSKERFQRSSDPRKCSLGKIF